MSASDPSDEPEAKPPAPGEPLPADLIGLLTRRLAEVDLERNQIIDDLSRLQAGPVPASLKPGVPGVPTWLSDAPLAPSPVFVARNAGPANEPTAAPRAQPREWTAKRVQNLLLTLGAVLYAVAALLFVAFAWGRLGLGGRVALMVAVTILTGVAGHVAHRRVLVATAEALISLCAVLALIDVGAAYSLDLWGVQAIEPWVYWGITLAVIALLAGLYRRRVPLSAPAVLALVLGQGPLILVATNLDVAASISPAVVLGAQILVLVLVWQRLQSAPRLRTLAELSGASALTTWALLATGLGLFALTHEAAHHEPFLYDLGALGVVGAVAAGVAALTLTSHPRLSRYAVIGSLGTISVAALAAADQGISGTASSAFVALSGAGIVAIGLLGRRWAREAAGVGGLTAGIGLATVLGSVAEAMIGPSAWVFSTWTLAPGSTARLANAPSGPWTGDGAVLVVLGAFALTVALAGYALDRLRTAGFVLGVMAAVTVDVALVTSGLPFEWAIALLTVLVVGVLLTATAIRDPSARLEMHAICVALAAQCVLWSLADTTATLVVLAVGAAVGASLARLDHRVAPAALATSATLVLALTSAGAAALDQPVDRSGFFLVAAACAIALAGAALGRRWTGVQGFVGVGFVGATLGLLQASGDGGWLSWSVAVVGIAFAFFALLPGRRRWGWASSGAMLLFCWLRLSLAGVTVVEAYSLPLGLLLLIAGLLRRRSDPQAASWAAYGQALTAGFVPSTLALASTSSVIRPGALAAVALLVLLIGAHHRLQALLTVSSAVLLVDAIAQFGPYVQRLPRWIGVGIIGSLLLFVGATYERRRRNLDELRNRYDSLG